MAKNENKQLLPNDLRACQVQVRPNGEFAFQWSKERPNFTLIDCGDPQKKTRKR